MREAALSYVQSGVVAFRTFFSSAVVNTSIVLIPALKNQGLVLLPGQSLHARRHAQVSGWDSLVDALLHECHASVDGQHSLLVDTGRIVEVADHKWAKPGELVRSLWGVAHYA